MMNQAALQENVIVDENTSKYMHLSTESMNILIPRTDIISVESKQAIENSDPTSLSYEYIQYKDSRIPVYSLSDRLEVGNRLPDDNSIFAILKYYDSYISLACIEVSAFREQIIKNQPLPECLQVTPGPIESLCLYNNNNSRDVIFIVSAKSLARFIDEMIII